MRISIASSGLQITADGDPSELAAFVRTLTGTSKEPSTSTAAVPVAAPVPVASPVGRTRTGNLNMDAVGLYMKILRGSSPHTGYLAEDILGPDYDSSKMGNAIQVGENWVKRQGLDPKSVLIKLGKSRPWKYQAGPNSDKALIAYNNMVGLFEQQ